MAILSYIAPESMQDSQLILHPPRNPDRSDASEKLETSLQLASISTSKNQNDSIVEGTDTVESGEFPPMVAPPDRRARLATANSRVFQLVDSINEAVNVRLKLSELVDKVAHLSDVKETHERALKAFEKSAIRRRDKFVQMYQSARGNIDSFRSHVHKSIYRGGKQPRPPAQLTAVLPKQRSLPKRVRAGAAWRRIHEQYHGRSHWTISGAMDHIKTLEAIFNGMDEERFSVERRIRIAEEGTELISETIEELRNKLQNPPHHIYEDAWQSYVRLWEAVAHEDVTLDNPGTLLRYVNTVPAAMQGSFSSIISMQTTKTQNQSTTAVPTQARDRNTESVLNFETFDPIISPMHVPMRAYTNDFAVQAYYRPATDANSTLDSYHLNTNDHGVPIIEDVPSIHHSVFSPQAVEPRLTARVQPWPVQPLRGLGEQIIAENSPDSLFSPSEPSPVLTQATPITSPIANEPITLRKRKKSVVFAEGCGTTVSI